ncbi:hypothetical protein ACFYS7_30675 [Streptomyces avermitilis]|uniref:hypothetical protein n=1 Tax=Streptomyces avermitilis TaxID=33903 RepID=UPI00368E8FF4
MFDTLAARLADGVKVRIVVSDPANRGAIGSGGYSQIKSLNEISDVLRKRLEVVTGSLPQAKAAMCANLQLASSRYSDGATWADGKPYAQHHKLVSVDGSAFYIGSKNLYPSWLQDFGYIVESPTAAGQLKSKLLDPQWTYSRTAATYDYTRHLPGLTETAAARGGTGHVVEPHTGKSPRAARVGRGATSSCIPHERSDRGRRRRPQCSGACRC